MADAAPLTAPLQLKGAFFGQGSGSKIFLEPTYVDNQVWFWKYSPFFINFVYEPNGASPIGCGGPLTYGVPASNIPSNLLSLIGGNA